MVFTFKRLKEYVDIKFHVRKKFHGLSSYHINIATLYYQTCYKTSGYWINTSPTIPNSRAGWSSHLPLTLFTIFAQSNTLFVSTFLHYCSSNSPVTLSGPIVFQIIPLQIQIWSQSNFIQRLRFHLFLKWPQTRWRRSRVTTASRLSKTGSAPRETADEPP